MNLGIGLDEEEGDDEGRDDEVDMKSAVAGEKVCLHFAPGLQPNLIAQAEYPAINARTIAKKGIGKKK